MDPFRHYSCAYCHGHHRAVRVHSGTYRFRFALNRIHSAAISDTFCMFFILVGLAVASGFSFSTLKILLILAFMWCTSPISGHMLSSLEYHTDEHLDEHCEFRKLKAKEDK